MAQEQEWLEQKLAEIEEKRATLKLLEETLSKWETEVDWEAAPPEKKAALMDLAQESVGALAVLIENLGSQIQEGMAELDTGASEDNSE
jgi:DNA repair exonuclease SbcCD ATPase subunit